MKIILPSFAIGILTAGTLLGQTDDNQRNREQDAPATVAAASSRRNLEQDAPATASPPESADLLVQRAAEALAEHRSISARVRFHVELFGWRPDGRGIYLQQGLALERKIRWELKSNVGEQITTWVQVRDGRYLWQFSDLAADEPSLTRVDLRRVRQALEQSEKKQPKKPANPTAELAIGGLPQLVESLRQSFRFTRAEAGQLDQLPVWIAAGSWKPKALKAVSKELAEQAADVGALDLEALPPQLPEEVLIYLGQDDLFPYRIEYRRTAGQGRAGEGEDGPMTPIVLLELYEVRLDAPIEPRQFEYEPAGDVADTTASFLKTLGVK